MTDNVPLPDRMIRQALKDEGFKGKVKIVSDSFADAVREVDRLRAMNADLLAALQGIMAFTWIDGPYGEAARVRALDAIEKARG